MPDRPKRIFDPRLRAQHRARATRIDGERFLWREAAEGLADRLNLFGRRFETALAIEPQAVLPAHAAHWTQSGFDGNETLTAEGRYDLIVSLMSLHGMNDLPGALAQVRARLNHGGFFAAALFGGESLHELREALAAGESETTGGATMRVAPFADIRDLGRLMVRAGFAHPVADSERTRVRYGDVLTLVRDLRAMGETGGLTERRCLRREALAATLEQYRSAHGEDGRLIATFDIVYLTGSAG